MYEAESDGGFVVKMETKSANWLGTLAGSADAATTLMLLSLCLLVPTNDLGSNGIRFCFLWLLVRQPGLRADWWQATRGLMLAGFAYLLILGAMAFSPMHGLKDGWYTMQGLLFSLLACYLLRLPVEKLRSSALLAVIVMTLYAIGVLLFNFHRYGVHEALTRQWLDSLVHRNRLAVGLATAYLLAAAFSLTTPGGRQRALFVACAVLLFVISYINNSRGALMGMVFASVALGFLWNWRLTTVLAVATGLLLCLAWQQGWLEGHATHGGTIDNGRDDIWWAVWDRIRLHPWTGYGLHALPFDPVFNKLHPELMKGHPHSIYIELVYASGIIGVLFWLAWYWRMGVAVRRSFVAQARDTRYLGLAFVVYILVHGSVDFSFYAFAVPVTLIIGFVMLLAPLRQPDASAGPA